MQHFITISDTRFMYTGCLNLTDIGNGDVSYQSKAAADLREEKRFRVLLMVIIYHVVTSSVY